MCEMLVFSYTIIQDKYIYINILRPRQNGRHFPDDIFIWISLNENVWISIKISWNFIAKSPINIFSSIGSDNGLAPSRWQTIIWTNDG